MRPDEAESFDREAVQRTRKIEPPYRDDVIACNFRLATDLFYLRKFKEARMQYTETLKMVKLGGTTSKVTVSQCEDGIAFCGLVQDRWHRAITEVLKRNKSAEITKVLGDTKTTTARDRWHVAITEVVRKNRIVAVIEAFQQSKRTIASERWHRATTEIIRQNRERKIAATLEASQKNRRAILVRERWQRAIVKVINNKRESSMALLVEAFQQNKITRETSSETQTPEPIPVHSGTAQSSPLAPQPNHASTLIGLVNEPPNEKLNESVAGTSLVNGECAGGFPLLKDPRHTKSSQCNELASSCHDRDTDEENQLQAALFDAGDGEP
jgi:hypothetical protein